MGVNKDLCIPYHLFKGYGAFMNFSDNFLNSVKMTDLLGNIPRFFFDYSELSIKGILTELDAASDSFSDPLIYSITNNNFMDYNHFVQISKWSVDYSNYHFTIPRVIKIILEQDLSEEKLTNLKKKVKTMYFSDVPNSAYLWIIFRNCDEIGGN
jgi:hypothetical protein